MSSKKFKKVKKKMKCFSLHNNKIVEGITNMYSNTLNTDIIYEASVRFYICDKLGSLIADTARSRYEDLFLYGYTELIPDSEPGTLFPEGSYLLDLPITQYNSNRSKNCMKIQTVNDHILLGCIKDSVVVTDAGYITMSDDGLVFDTNIVVPDDLQAQDNILIVEL
jgi:hypothetical protein